MEIRLAIDSDVKDVRDLVKALAAYEGEENNFNADEKYFLDYLINNQTTECYVLEEQGEIIGTGTVFPSPATYAGSIRLNLQDFFVKEAHRGKGYGKQFLQFLAALANEKGYESVCWGVLEDNDLATRFYDSVASSNKGIIYYNLGSKEIDALLEPSRII